MILEIGVSCYFGSELDVGLACKLLCGLDGFVRVSACRLGVCCYTAVSGLWVGWVLSRCAYLSCLLLAFCDGGTWCGLAWVFWVASGFRLWVYHCSSLWVALRWGGFWVFGDF